MTHSVFIDIEHVCTGMYIQLDVGWLRHPFPVSSFRISSPEQVQLLRSLGIASIRCIPAKSDPEILSVLPSFTNEEEITATWLPDAAGEEARQNSSGDGDGDGDGELAWRQKAEDAVSLISTWSEAAALKNCNLRFSAATHGYRQVVDELVHKPGQAMQTSSSLVAGYIAELLDTPHTAIRCCQSG